jgi:hypothetical protein
MDTENESLPSDERASGEQQIRNTPDVGQPVKPVPRMQRITFLMTTITGVLLSNTQQSFSTALNEVLTELPVYGFSLLIVGFYFFAFRALLVPMVFILSIAIILFRNDLAVYFWLLVIVVEVADVVYRRIRRSSQKEDQLQVEADV